MTAEPSGVPTVSGVKQTGHRSFIQNHGNRSSGPEDRRHKLDNGEREFRATEVAGPLQMAGLRHRLRLAVRQVDSDNSTCDLKQARVKLDTEPIWSSLFKADSETHDLATGANVSALLASYGGLVGSPRIESSHRQKNAHSGT